MSILCDVFVAENRDAERYFEILEQNPEQIAPPRFWICSFPGFTPEEFSSLGELLRDDFHNVALIHLAHEESGQWWLEQFGDWFTVSLVSLDDLARGLVAQKWSEVSSKLSDQESAREYLELLCKLAKQSIESKMPMFLWGSV